MGLSLPEITMDVAQTPRAGPATEGGEAKAGKASFLETFGETPILEGEAMPPEAEGAAVIRTPRSLPGIDMTVLAPVEVPVEEAAVPVPEMAVPETLAPEGAMPEEGVVLPQDEPVEAGQEPGIAAAEPALRSAPRGHGGEADVPPRMAAFSGTASQAAPVAMATQATEPVVPTGTTPAMAAAAPPPVQGLPPVENRAKSGTITDIAPDALVGATPKDAELPAMPRTPAPAVPMTQTGNDAAHEIVRASLAAKGNGTVELRLDPSELGKLDIEFTVTDDRLSIAVKADREDALDLMRRSSDELARLLRQAGVDFDGLDFSRREGGEGADDAPLGSLAMEGGDGPVEPAPMAPLPTADTRIDIRI